MLHLNMTDNVKTALGDMRQSDKPSGLFGVDLVACDKWLRRQTDELLTAAGVTAAPLDAYREFERQVGMHYRTKTGYDLAFNIELCLRRWCDWGLDSGMLQTLVCRIHQELSGRRGASQ